MLTRRRLIQSGLTTAAAVSFGPAFWRDAFAAPAGEARADRARTGALRPPDANGIMLPAGLHLAGDRPLDGGHPRHGLRLPVYPDGAGDVPDRRRRRLDPRRQLRGPGGRRRRVRDPLRRRTAASPPPTAILGSTSTTARAARRRGARGSRARRSRAAWCGSATSTSVNAGRRAPADGRLPARGGVRGRRHQQVYLSEDVDGGGLYRFTPDRLSGPLRRPAGDRVRRRRQRGGVEAGARSALGCGVRRTRSQVAGLDQVRAAARASGSTAASSTSSPPPTRPSTSTTRTPRRSSILYRAADVPGTPLLGIDNILSRGPATCWSPRTPTATTRTRWTSA